MLALKYSMQLDEFDFVSKAKAPPGFQGAMIFDSLECASPQGDMSMPVVGTTRSSVAKRVARSIDQVCQPGEPATHQNSCGLKPWISSVVNSGEAACVGHRLCH